MSDLISRQAAIDGKISIQRANGVEIYSDEAVPVEYLKRLPSAEPVRHGKWKQRKIVQECFDIDGNKTWGIKYMCESCGFKTIAIEGHFAQYKYCPQCGARMDEE
jgi:predicted RNA-binding Zn-ribbon protein involved in translation (DUF1610 family)